MTRRVVAIYHSPWPAEGLARPLHAKPLAQYRYAVWYKSNPRTPQYMRALLQEHFPGAEWVSADEGTSWHESLAQADTIVLLYSDSIGLGFARIERAVIRHKRVWANVEALNGRRRKFKLNAVTRLGLNLRRMLEWSMLPEFAFLPAFIIATPVLWAIDAVRGHR